MENKHNYHEIEKKYMKEKPQAGGLMPKFCNIFKILPFYMKKKLSVAGIFAQVFMSFWNLKLFYNYFIAKLTNIDL